MTREQKMSIMCDIGDTILYTLQDMKYIKFKIENDNEDDSSYTPEAQELFDKIYDILDNNIPDEESNR